MLKFLKALALAALLAAPSNAMAISFASSGQTRSVSSCGGIVLSTPMFCSQLPATDRDADVSEVTDLLPFFGSVSSSFSAFSGGGGVASADQSSVLTAQGIEATGSVFSSAFFGAHIAEARSSLNITFQISTETAFQLSGEIGAESDARTSIRLVGESGSIAFVSLAGSPNTGIPGFGMNFSFSDVLLPGEYSLIATTSSCSDEIGFCGQDLGMGFYDVTLVVPEPTSGLLLAMGLALMSNCRGARPDA